MKLWPQGLLGRMLLAGAAAALVIAVLELFLRQSDGVALAAERRAAPAPPRVATAPPAVADAMPDRGLAARTVALCGRADAAPAAEALWQLLTDGSAVVRRPPPLPTAPGRQQLGLVAIVLPGTALRDLTAEQRAGLLDLLAALLRQRPVAADRVRLSGIGGSPRDVAMLLAWLR